MIQFHGFNVTPIWTNYLDNGRTCLLLDCGGTMAASVNIDGPMEEDEIAIKDYSENIGMLRTLVGAGIVAEPHRWVRSGFVSIPICRMLEGPIVWKKLLAEEAAA